eukprot:3427831-Rhodomonas_salina.1
MQAQGSTASTVAVLLQRVLAAALSHTSRQGGTRCQEWRFWWELQYYFTTELSLWLDSDSVQMLALLATVVQHFIGIPDTIDGHFWWCSKLALPGRVFSPEFHCWHWQQHTVPGPAKK